MKRILAALCAVGLAAALAASGAGARTGDTPSPPPDGPDLSAMALSPTDVHTARAAGQQYLMRDVQLEYERFFGPSAHLGVSPLGAIVSVVLLYDDGDTAALDIEAARNALGSKKGRQLTGVQAIKSLGGKAIGDPIVGPLRTFAAGDEAFGYVSSIKTKKAHYQLAIAFTRVDRVGAFFLLLSRAEGKVPVGDVAKAVSLAADHMRTGLTIANVAPPVITGNPVQGQTLTADHGHWTGGPSVETYQWSRCDAATGATCTPVDGATAATYVAGPADVGTRLSVTVTARNGVSSATATTTEPTAST